jgi:23S rRNA pseudouridine1911/1915/1917 synthase
MSNGRHRMREMIELKKQVPDSMAGKRLDQVAAELFTDYSRGQLQKWIKSGELTVDSKKGKSSARVLGGETICVEAELVSEGSVEPQKIPLEIVFKDEQLIVLNKPAGLVVHPAAGNWDGTLQNALLHHYSELAALPRSGIVHRLDKETSGVMVVARSLKAHASLVKQLQTRTMSRVYEAVVKGEIPPAGTIDAPIDRNPRDRKKMAVVYGGKPAVSHFRLIQHLPGCSHVEVSLESGRTHQIRVHLTHIGYPIVGDPLYGKGPVKQKGLSPGVVAAINGFPRQALHARKLRLKHPVSDADCEFTAPLEKDMSQLLTVLVEALSNL